MDETVEFFSAPGEGLECVEIARRVLRAASPVLDYYSQDWAVTLTDPEGFASRIEHFYHDGYTPFTQVGNPEPRLPGTPREPACWADCKKAFCGSPSWLNLFRLLRAILNCPTLALPTSFCVRQM